ncbi:MAG: CHAT domain-containing protein [Bacteroidales bacterium]|nr:CHAT domain-containing protein [Bacteroidales bacterium]
MAFLSLSISSFSQDKALLARADSLHQLGCDLFAEQKYEEAIVLFENAAEIRRKQLGVHSADFANSINNVGKCYYELGSYAKALDYGLQALEIRRRVLGMDHPDFALSLNNIGLCYARLGDYVKAQGLFLRAMEIQGRAQGKDHPDYARSLKNFGLCYALMFDYTKAKDYFLQAMEILGRALGKDHPEYAYSLNNVGACYFEMGDYTKALDYLLQALEFQERVLGKDHPDYAIYLRNIGTCYIELGNYAKALDYLLQALEIQERVQKKGHPDHALSLNNIGWCYIKLGEYFNALDYCQRALESFERLFGKENPSYARSLGNIGICYKHLNDFIKAIDYHLRSLSIIERTSGKENSVYINDLTYLGECYYSMGDYAAALSYAQKALEIKEIVYGESHHEYARSLLDIGECYFILEDFSKASEFFVQYSSTISAYISSSFSSLTESMRESFWKKFNGFYTNRLYDYSVTISTSQMHVIAYDGALLSKGLLLNAETEMRKLILESGDEEALRMYNEVQQSRIRLDKIYEDPVGKKALIDSLNNDIEARQQELMKRSKVFGDYTRNLALKWTDVQAALGKKDIAIEFETYTHQDTTFYIALTLRPGYTAPHLVELFNSTQMKAKSDSKAYYTSTTMSKLIWGNLAEELNGVKNVYFSPAGELNNIGIEYMLDEDGEHLLSEKRNYYRLTSTRELAKEHQSKKMSDATIYGGIRYDVTPGSKLTGEETESERLALAATRSYTPLDSLSTTRGGWKYLPGTKEEAESISTTLTSKRVKNELLEGEAGTEESFKALGGARNDVIHIATHGFYWTETEAGRSGMETSSFMLDGESKAPKEDKALTHSGLLFAGAQNAFDGKEIPIDVEDGILTAKDISRMDLRGTDLVVISACQSGLGEVTGDGVFGLQRGFKKAGVQSIVMSLWEVDDNATKLMMTRFYENLAKGRSKYVAFREAQNYLRMYDGGLYDEPEYYAAFVLLDAIK